MPRSAALLLAIMIVAGCATRTPAPSPATVPIPLTPPAEAATAPVVREKLELPPSPPVADAPTSSLPSTAIPPPVVPGASIPPGTLYVCLTDQAGHPQQTAIEFIPKVADLCRRHPEMGPCQYEREVCRRAGGRVFAADGKEITRLTEAEYDRKVLRVRFRAN